MPSGLEAHSQGEVNGRRKHQALSSNPQFTGALFWSEVDLRNIFLFDSLPQCDGHRILGADVKNVGPHTVGRFIDVVVGNDQPDHRQRHVFRVLLGHLCSLRFQALRAKVEHAKDRKNRYNKEDYDENAQYVLNLCTHRDFHIDGP